MRGTEEALALVPGTDVSSLVTSSGDASDVRGRSEKLLPSYCPVILGASYLPVDGSFQTRGSAVCIALSLLGLLFH